MGYDKLAVRRKRILVDLLATGGTIMVGAGLWCYAPALALVVVGGILLVAAIWGTMR